MGNVKSLFIDYTKSFSEETWAELSDKAEIEYEVIPNEYRLIFKLKLKPLVLSVDLWSSILRLSKRECLEIRIEGFELKYLLDSFLQGIDYEFQGDKLELFIKTLDQEERAEAVKYLISEALSLVYKKRVGIGITKPDITNIPYCVFDKEERVSHKGIKKYKVGITDWDNFYWLSLSNKSQEEADKLYSKLQINDYYSVKFNLTKNPKYSEFIDGFLVSAKEHEYKDKKEVDEAPRKIYSFCIHTKNSAFDGLYTAEDFLDQAHAFKHKALGITDSSSVQSYSALEKKAKALGIKPIYGTELELLPEDYLIVVNDVKLWNKSSICIFDIETTGLNPLVDDLIQVAIKKYEHKKEVGTYVSYVKTSKKLPPHITNLTNITDEVLRREGRNVKDVLREAQEFIEDSLLIAHNGIAFDLPFLNAKYRAYRMDPIENPLLDPLKLSQALFLSKNYKSHSLAAICKRASKTYDEEEAHNAEYDAGVLADCFYDYLLPELNASSLSLNALSEFNARLFDQNLYNHVYGNNVLLYIKSQKGVRNLYEIISLAHTKFLYSRPKITKEQINQLRDGLIVVSPPINSEVVAAILNDDEERMKRIIDFYDYIIIPPPSHFEFEINTQQLTIEDSKFIVAKLREICIKYEKPYLLNSAVRYLFKRDYERYLVLINTKGLAGRRHYLYNPKFRKSHYPIFNFKNTDSLIAEYDFLKDSKALDEVYDYQERFLSEIGDDIEVIKKELNPPTIAGIGDKLKKHSFEALKQKYGLNPDPYILDKYEYEIQSIEKNNYFVIYWVSHLLVQESISNGYLVGSRGSVGSSFVAFLMGISEVNPLPPHYYCPDCSYFEVVSNFLETGFDLLPKQCPSCNKPLKTDGHNIPFETFLGFDGNKVPDIDLNFSGEYQSKAHDFLKKFFGEDKVFRAGTISAMADKTAYAVVKEYLEESNQNTQNKGKFKWLISNLVNVKRTSGQHPGGILVVPESKSIHEFTPINFPANDHKSEWLTTHLEFEDLHDSLLKFDILGHDDPTTLAQLKALTGVDPSIISYSDPKILELYRSCKILGIEEGVLVNDDNTGSIGLPEFGTILTRNIIKDCKPKSFADLVRISGFSHGTGVWKNNIDRLVKKGYKLNQVITCRDDIMIYLLSMGLSREIAFSVSEDIRKGKGISEENIELLRKHNVPDWYIESSKKITYIFPKAHASAYVLMSWKIAFYKLYYPLAFYSVYFSLSSPFFDWDTIRTNNFGFIKSKYEEMSKKLKNPGVQAKFKDKRLLIVYEVALEFLARGFEFEKINVNRSSWDRFLIIGDKLIMPLIVIDGLGEIKAKAIEEERRNGNYVDEEDLIERTSINKKVIEVLRDKKALDFI